MIETLTLEETTEYLRSHGMRISKETVADGIEQGVYPFGDCIKKANSKSKKRIFTIYRALLDRWMQERTTA